MSLYEFFETRNREGPFVLGKIFRFTRFEADRERHKLSCSGRRIKLERIPLELLFLLLEEEGRVVTREQIVTRVWGTDLVLDTERSINTAIRKLRKALTDDARDPEFIETLVGKGYRFIALYTQGDGSASSQLRDMSHSSLVTGPNHMSSERREIRLADFRIEANGSLALVCCSIIRAGQVIGRLPLVRLELPDGMTLPLQPEDKLLMKLLGVRAKLTPDATRALQAFCIGFLQNLSTTRLVQSPAVAESFELQPVGGEKLEKWDGGDL
jgi:DNA-binding winged helix-turn-helix (wHTH) protein